MGLFVMLLTCSREAPTPQAAPADKSGAAAGAKAQRLVSLTPSCTEIVWALGCADALIAVDEYSRFPPSVTSLPTVGSFLTPNLERIAALRPSLVLVDDVQGAAAAALAQLGIATAPCSLHSLGDVTKVIAAVGPRLAAPDAVAAAVARVEAALATAANAPSLEPLATLYIIGRDPGAITGLVGAGPGSWLDEVGARVGLVNVLRHAPTRYPKLGQEQVLLAKPALIIDVSLSPGAEAWSSLPLSPRPRIVVRDDAFLLAPSPRVAEALEVMRAVR